MNQDQDQDGEKIQNQVRTPSGLSVNHLLNDEDHSKNQSHEPQEVENSSSQREIKALPSKHSNTSTNTTSNTTTTTDQPESQPSTSQTQIDSNQKPRKKTKSSSTTGKNKTSSTSSSVLQETVPADGGISYQYAAVKQQLEDRDKIEYQLTIREQPRHSRMCGVGEKADRRPIDPAPIVQLRVITHDQPLKRSRHKNSNLTNQRIEKDHPSKESDILDSKNSTRRGQKVTTDEGVGWEDKAWYLENPYFFMLAVLVDADADEELHVLPDGRTRYTTGSCVSSLYHLKDIDGSHQAFFVFPDLSVRVEGIYRLKLCLFETVGNQVHHCRSVYSVPFNVFTAKRFPGMEESTPLSKSFADQGLKVRVRKNPRTKRRSTGTNKKENDSTRSDGESDADEIELPSIVRGAKRARGMSNSNRGDQQALSSGSSRSQGRTTTLGGGSISTSTSQSGNSSGRLSKSQSEGRGKGKGKSTKVFEKRSESDSFSSSNHHHHQPQLPPEVHKSPYSESSSWTTPSSSTYSPQQIHSSLPTGYFNPSSNRNSHPHPHPQLSYQSEPQPQPQPQPQSSTQPSNQPFYPSSSSSSSLAPQISSRNRNNYDSASRYEPPPSPSNKYDEDGRIHPLPPPIPTRYSSHSIHHPPPNTTNISNLQIPRSNYSSTTYPSSVDHHGGNRQIETSQIRSSSNASSIPSPTSSYHPHQSIGAGVRDGFHHQERNFGHYDSKDNRSKQSFLPSNSRSFSGQDYIQSNSTQLNPILGNNNSSSFSFPSSTSQNIRERSFSDPFDNHHNNNNNNNTAIAQTNANANANANPNHHRSQSINSQNQNQQSIRSLNNPIPPSFLQSNSDSIESSSRFGDRTLPPLNLAVPNLSHSHSRHHHHPPPPPPQHPPDSR